MPGVGGNVWANETCCQNPLGLGDKLGVAGGGKPIEFLSDYRQLLDGRNDDVDAVIVCTPNFHHVEFLRDLFAAAKKNKNKGRRRLHVLCEKPLCTTVADCLEVRALVKEAEREDAGSSPLFWVGMECKCKSVKLHVQQKRGCEVH